MKIRTWIGVLALWLTLTASAFAAVTVEVGEAPDNSNYSDESGDAIVEDKYEPYIPPTEEPESTYSEGGNRMDQVLRKQDQILQVLAEIRKELEVVKIRASQR